MHVNILVSLFAHLRVSGGRLTNSRDACASMCLNAGAQARSRVTFRNMSDNGGQFNGADRQRAYRLHRMPAEKRSAPDAAWLKEYEGSKRQHATEKITHTEERTLQQATGEAATLDASAALARAEGVRVDTLLALATNGLTTALDYHQAMSSMLLERVSDLMASQATLMESVGTHYLARVDAEAAAITAAAASEDPLSTFAMSALQGAMENGKKKKPPPKRKRTATAKDIADRIKQARTAREAKEADRVKAAKPATTRSTSTL